MSPPGCSAFGTPMPRTPWDPRRSFDRSSATPATGHLSSRSLSATKNRRQLLWREQANGPAALPTTAPADPSYPELPNSRCRHSGQTIGYPRCSRISTPRSSTRPSGRLSGSASWARGRADSPHLKGVPRVHNKSTNVPEGTFGAIRPNCRKPFWKDRLRHLRPRSATPPRSLGD